MGFRSATWIRQSVAATVVGTIRLSTFGGSVGFAGIQRYTDDLEYGALAGPSACDLELRTVRSQCFSRPFSLNPETDKGRNNCPRESSYSRYWSGIPFLVSRRIPTMVFLSALPGGSGLARRSAAQWDSDTSRLPAPWTSRANRFMVAGGMLSPSHDQAKGPC